MIPLAQISLSDQLASTKQPLRVLVRGIAKYKTLGGSGELRHSQFRAWATSHLLLPFRVSFFGKSVTLICNKLGRFSVTDRNRG